MKQYKSTIWDGMNLEFEESDKLVVSYEDTRNIRDKKRSRFTLYRIDPRSGESIPLNE